MKIIYRLIATPILAIIAVLTMLAVMVTMLLTVLVWIFAGNDKARGFHTVTTDFLVMDLWDWLTRKL